jgi:carbon-monoxide dehydrogenase small subunit
MRQVSLVINGRDVQAEIEPRLNLADFLRDYQSLTATHVGCEHGVCGTCTVLIDGAPARSCITFAAAADGAKITTLEGLEGDLVADILREAFSAHHGLQCGFCTPGMMMTARDIIKRLPDADEKRIRLELSGNLCRCTGYVGIVNAIQAALAEAKAAGHAGAPAAERTLGPVGAHAPSVPRNLSRRPASAHVPQSAPAAAENFDAVDWNAVEREGVEIRQSLMVPFPQAQVWRFFADLDQVARCMPGARLTKPVQGNRAEGEINIKLGPIVSAFQGALGVTRDDAAYCGVVRGAGRDARSPSRARAIITYVVSTTGADRAKIDVSVKFLLSGALAQFSRPGLVKDVADHITRLFAENLAARLSGRPAESHADAALDAGAAARSALWKRLERLFRCMFGG